MSLYKRKGSKYYWYKFEIDGVPYRGSTKLKSKRDAEGIESKARLNVIEGKYDIQRQKEAPLFKDAMAQFLEHARQQHAEHPNTAKVYAQASKPLIKAFGSKKLNVITPEDVEKYKKARLKSGIHGRPLKPATVNGDLACLRVMFSYFIALKAVTENPVSRIKFFPVDNGKDRVLSFEEERLYLAAAPQPLYDIAVLMIETGARPDELYNLLVENVSLDEAYIFIPKGKTKAARRKLPLTRRAIEALRLRLDGEYVFPHSGDPSRPMGKVNYLHTKALEASGIAYCRLYDCRHTFGTRAAESGVDLVTLAALMGHSKVQQVMRYAHPQAEHKAQAIRKMEERAMEEHNKSEMIQ
jgi:integrase